MSEHKTNKRLNGRVARAALWVAAGLGLATPGVVHATDYVWAPAGVDSLWENGANWAGTVAPPTAVPVGDTTVVVFDSALGTATTSQMTSNYSLTGLVFGSTFAATGTFGLTTSDAATNAHTLTLGSGGIVNNSTNAISITRGALTPSASITLAADQEWAINQPTGLITSNRDMTGSGRWTKSGPGSAAFSGAVTVTGGLVVTGGQITFSSSTASISGPSSISNATVIARANTFAATSTVTMSGGAVLGSATTGNHTFPNPFRLTGNVQLGTNAQSSRLSFSGILDLTGGNRTITVANTGSGSRAIEITAGRFINGELTLAGLPGAGGVRIGTTVVPSGLTVRALTLYLAGGGALSSANALTLDTNGVLELWDPGSTSTGTGPMRSPTVGSLSGVGRVNINAPFDPLLTGTATFSVVGPSTGSFSGTLSDALSAPGVRMALTVSGGQQTLTTAQTFTGPTTVAGTGRLILGAGATLAGNIAVQGGTLDLAAAYPAGYNVAANTTFAASGNIIGQINVPAGALARTNTSVDHSLAATITGLGGFQKSNSSTVTLTGAVTTASVQVSQGKLIVGPAGSVNTPSLNVSSGLMTVQGAVAATATTVSSNAVLDLSAAPAGLTIPVGGSLLMNGPIIGNVANNVGAFIGSFITNNGDMTYPTNFSGTGSLTRSAVTPGNIAGTSTMTGLLNLGGGVNVQGGWLVAKTPMLLRPSVGTGSVTGSLVVTGPGSTAVLDATGYASAGAYARAGEFVSISVGSTSQTGTPSAVTLSSVSRPANKPAVAVTSGLTIAADAGTSYSGFVDLGNGDLIVRGGAAAETTLRSYVAAWLGSGVTKVGLGSSVATPGAAPFTTLAVFPNSGGFFASYDGVTALTSADAIVKYTYVGDTDLNGVLDGNDLANVLEGYSTGATGWAAGDADYSGGAVDAADVGAFLAAYAWYTNPANGAISLGNGQGGASSGGAIPEPSALALLAAPATLLGRKRRSR